MTAPAVSEHSRLSAVIRALPRAGVIVAMMGAFAGLRMDRFLRIAGETDWVPAAIRDEREKSMLADYCLRHFCPRFPEDGVPALVGIGLVVTAVVLVVLFYARHVLRESALKAGTATRTPDILLWVLWGLIALGGIALAVVRHGTALEQWPFAWVMGLGYAQFGFIVLSVGVLARLKATQRGGRFTWRRMARTIADQRATILVLLLLAMVFLFLPIGSDQVADALRALDGGTPVGRANLLFVFAAACLLSAAALEIWRATDRENAESPAASTPRVVRRWIWFSIGAVAVVVGVTLFLLGLIGLGLAVVGGMCLLFGLFELGARKAATGASTSQNMAMQGNQLVHTNTPPGARASTIRTYRVSAAARYVAAIPMAALAVAFSGAIAESLITDGLWTRVIGPGIEVVLLASFAVFLTRTVARQTESRHDGVEKVLLPALFLVVLWIFAFGGFRAEAIQMAGLLCAIALGFHLWVVGRRERDHDGASSYWSFGFAIIIAAAITVGLHVAPVALSRSIGTIALMLFFVAGILGVGFLVSRLAFNFSAPQALEWFNIRRLPVFTMVLIVWVVAGALPYHQLHDVRITTVDAKKTAPVTIAAAFRTWVNTQPEFRKGGEPAITTTIPLVLIASHGGGIRAAYWTGTVLDCIVGVDPADPQTQPTRYGTDCGTARRSATESLTSAGRVFIASGVSGGAVGLAAYSEQMLSGGLDPAWLDRRLGDDLLAPVIGWGLFHDFPNHLLGLPGGGCDAAPAGGLCALQDRAAILEQAIDFDTSDPDQTAGNDAMQLRSTWADRVLAANGQPSTASAVPLLVFNSSTTGVPLRAVTSAANLADWPLPPSIPEGPDAVARYPVSDAADTVNMLCRDQDLRISTAAALAARFPYVTPSGVFTGNCDPSTDPTRAKAEDHRRCVETDTCTLQLADGGDLENSGLMTIAEILPTLQKLVVDQNAKKTNVKIAVVVVDIDNDYRTADPTATRPTLVGETLQPPVILLSGAKAMQAAAYGMVQERMPGGCFITLAPGKQPGIQAPLGWSLSPASRTNLRSSLLSDRLQTESVRNLQYWLRPDLGIGGDAVQPEVLAEQALDHCVLPTPRDE